MIGETVGDYRVTARLGQGGMGSVWLAEHALLPRRVALKVLHPAYAANAKARERFVREAEALSRLDHPGIVRLLGFHEHGSTYVMLLELAEGETLDRRLARLGPVAPFDAVRWTLDVLAALGYAHAHGVIHRDLKPSNLMLGGDGHVKLLDFGTAKLVHGKALTAQGMTLGTLAYMSREQVTGKSLDARSDLYSLGVTLYELLSGELPFAAKDERTLIGQILREPPRRLAELDPSIPEGLAAVVHKAFAREPADRFSTAEDFAAALRALAPTLPRVARRGEARTARFLPEA